METHSLLAPSSQTTRPRYEAARAQRPPSCAASRSHAQATRPSVDTQGKYILPCVIFKANNDVVGLGPRFCAIAPVQGAFLGVGRSWQRRQALFIYIHALSLVSLKQSLGWWPRGMSEGCSAQSESVLAVTRCLSPPPSPPRTLAACRGECARCDALHTPPPPSPPRHPPRTLAALLMTPPPRTPPTLPPKQAVCENHHMILRLFSVNMYEMTHRPRGLRSCVSFNTRRYVAVEPQTSARSYASKLWLGGAPLCIQTKGKAQCVALSHMGMHGFCFLQTSWSPGNMPCCPAFFWAVRYKVGI